MGNNSGDNGKVKSAQCNGSLESRWFYIKGTMGKYKSAGMKSSMKQGEFVLQKY